MKESQNNVFYLIYLLLSLTHFA